MGYESWCRRRAGGGFTAEFFWRFGLRRLNTPNGGSRGCRLRGLGGLFRSRRTQLVSIHGVQCSRGKCANAVAALLCYEVLRALAAGAVPSPLCRNCVASVYRVAVPPPLCRNCVARVVCVGFVVCGRRETVRVRPD